MKFSNVRALVGLFFLFTYLHWCVNCEQIADARWCLAWRWPCGLADITGLPSVPRRTQYGNTKLSFRIAHIGLSLFLCSSFFVSVFFFGFAKFLGEDCIFRPPVRSNERTYKMLVMFFFLFSPTVLWAPSTDALKLCHMIGIWPNFIMQVQKLGEHSPKKIRGPKTCKISVDFGPLQTLIANISGTGQHIQNRPRYKLWQFLLRLTKKVRWTLFH